MVLTVGDILMRRHNPERWEAIVSDVEADLSWLSARCDHVAVIAHSHGAVIATEVLSSRGADKVMLLITYGTVSSMLLNDVSSRGHWLDFVAHLDPFAGRQLPATAAGQGFRIRSQSSFLTAHWTYWRSTEEFALPIVAALMEVTGRAHPTSRRPSDGGWLPNVVIPVLPQARY
jgi:hypothetical protein